MKRRPELDVESGRRVMLGQQVAGPDLADHEVGVGGHPAPRAHEPHLIPSDDLVSHTGLTLSASPVLLDAGPDCGTLVREVARRGDEDTQW
jgi:hypothetical protein